MSIGSVGSSSIYQGFGGQSSGGSDPVGQLFSAIKSGNLSSAQSAYAALSNFKAPDSTSSGSSAFASLLSELGSALSSGNVSSAQSLLSSFDATNSLSGNQPPPPPPPPPGGGQTSSVVSALSNLFSSIQSGDLSSAQSAYSSVSSLLSGLTSSTSSSSSATSASSGSGSNETNPFAQLLASIGSDLSGGDIDSAQSALSNFAQNARTGITYDQFT